MIQRIQTLYLLLAAGLLAAFCLLPFVEFLKDGALFEQTVWGIRASAETPAIAETAEAVGYLVRTTPMGVLAALAALLPAVTIFLYRRRLLQLRLCIVEIVLLIGLLAYLVLYLVRTAGEFSDRAVFSFAAIFPLLALVLTVPAFRGISKDIVLVRSLDRLR